MRREFDEGLPLERADLSALTMKSATQSDDGCTAQPVAISEVEARHATCQAQVTIIQELVAQLFDLGCQGPLGSRAAARRPACHMRQITMYLCRVVLSMPYQHIADAIRRDRSTVIHGCAVIEDRRDGADYDAFIDRCEKCVRVVFGQVDEGNHEARG